MLRVISLNITKFVIVERYHLACPLQNTESLKKKKRKKMEDANDFQIITIVTGRHRPTICAARNHYRLFLWNLYPEVSQGCNSES